MSEDTSSGFLDGDSSTVAPTAKNLEKIAESTRIRVADMKRITAEHMDKAGQNKCTALVRQQLEQRIYPASDIVTQALIEQAIRIGAYAELLRRIEEEAPRNYGPGNYGPE